LPARRETVMCVEAIYSLDGKLRRRGTVAVALKGTLMPLRRLLMGGLREKTSENICRKLQKISSRLTTFYDS